MGFDESFDGGAAVKLFMISTVQSLGGRDFFKNEDPREPNLTLLFPFPDKIKSSCFLKSLLDSLPQVPVQ